MLSLNLVSPTLNFNKYFFHGTYNGTSQLPQIFLLLHIFIENMDKLRKWLLTKRHFSTKKSLKDVDYGLELECAVLSNIFENLGCLSKPQTRKQTMQI